MSTQETSRPDSPAARPAADDGISTSAYRRRWTTLVTLCVSLVAVMLANSSMNLALPALSRELGLSQLELTWIVEAYVLVFAALLFVASAVADRYGRRWVMQVGLVVFVAASFYAGFAASSGTELVAARALMGLGAALVLPTTLSIINVVFPASERARAIAVWSGIVGGSIVLGSILSGAILQFASWEWNFFVGGLIGLGAVVATQAVVPESRDKTGSAVDWVGGALVTVALLGIVYAIMESPSQGIADGTVMAALTAGSMALAIFVWWELRAPNPMLDLRIFRAPEVGLSALAITLAFFALMGAFYGLSQMLQLVMGFGVLASAAALLPAMVPLFVISPFVPRVVERVGTRWTVTPGLVLVAVGFLLMSLWPSEPAYWQVLGAMMVMTTGMAFVMTPATNLMMAAVPTNRSGMGSALNDTTRQLGAALGIAVLGSMISSGYSAGVGEAVARLPQGAADVAGGSLAGALVVAEQMGVAGVDLAEAARDAFMSGNASAMVVSLVVTLAAAAVFAVGVPGRHAESIEPVEIERG